MISNIERGLASPTKFKAPKLADVLQVSEPAILDTDFNAKKE